MSLYTQYRPKDWNDVVGQDLIVTILRANLQDKTTSHAYIFTGSRGTGKTTSARIFAKAVNCTNLQNGNPCHKCENCKAFDAGNMLDVIEIDGASNTGVENVRDLIEKAKFEPTQGQYKIYIIDEVHMLSTGAFNALLKTLEEPPKHVKFILATTEIHKVPETIKSRAQCFHFQKISEGDIQENLQKIIKNEGIIAEEGCIEIISKAARGGMRDAITLLEQHIINKSLIKEYLSSSLSIIDEHFLHKIIHTLVTKDYDTLLKICDKLIQNPPQTQLFFDQILFLLRDILRKNIANSNFHQYNAITQVFLKAYHSSRNIPDDILREITLFEAINVLPEKNITNILPETCNQDTTDSLPTISQKPLSNTINEGNVVSYFQGNNCNNRSNTPESYHNSEQNQKNTTQEGQESHNTEFSFRKLLDALKTEPMILATLKTASFSHNNNNLSLTFGNQWTANKINEVKTKTILTNTLQKTFGGEWTINSSCKTSSSINADTVDDIF